MEFGNQVVLVTGAAQGIGATIAHRFASEGAAVALLDRQAVAVQTVAAELGAQGARTLALAADIAQSSAIDEAIDRIERELGAIDVLVNAAAILRTGNILAYSDEDWDATLAVNAGGVFRVCRAVGRRMAERRRGAIVTVSSNAASVPRTGMGAYAASKAAVTHFSHCLALELAEHGVRCNVVSPGSTDTPMQRALWSGPDGAARTIAGNPEGWKLGIPLARIATPDDIADAALFLASARARHITMHDLRVDGGATLGA
ncbi:2,3-dihydro-2,3-dihydroxybenzoate dehydrogenase [Chitinolyticbacter albus]|uniref:2,3-dihydro-2,3-dihydroxybenzoate dehydrogenase n=1 Tax=Chitinolyticbacter albus TaxID=2961951 RepID=UPI00210A6219|nr:2,3-dihydro-2,3-dihydroxybenzoate dehydrogenase [Chitinolyticbacter albus]